MAIEHIWTCTCGTETQCRPEDQQLGAVYQCPKCSVVWGCVYPKAGGRAWVKIRDEDVAFHDLLGNRHEEDNEVDLADVFGYGPSAPGWREPKRY